MHRMARRAAGEQGAGLLLERPVDLGRAQAERGQHRLERPGEAHAAIAVGRSTRICAAVLLPAPARPQKPTSGGKTGAVMRASSLVRLVIMHPVRGRGRAARRPGRAARSATCLALDAHTK